LLHIAKFGGQSSVVSVSVFSDGPENLQADMAQAMPAERAVPQTAGKDI